MGGEVPRVPERPPVAGTGGGTPPADPGFGGWYRTQRELRGVAAEYVSDRTKLAPQRIDAIERGDGLLRADGQGRLTARALAEAIGADGDEAVRVLVECERAAAAPERGIALPSARGVAAALILALAGGAGWWLVDHLLRPSGPDASVEIVHRPDYVRRALEGER